MTAPLYDRTRLRRTLIVLALVIILAALTAIGRQLVFGDLARAVGPYNVNDLGDDFDAIPGDGLCDVDMYTTGDQCTLRAAIQEVNYDGNGDTINISATGTIVLTADLPTITIYEGTLYINGPGSDDLTIDGGDLYQIFHIHFYTPAAVISGMTLTNGQASSGGAIYNQAAALTLDDVIITSSTATSWGGAIANWGSLEMSNSTISDNSASSGGGGIYISDFGDASIANSTISDNQAWDGGGVYLYGTLAMTDTIVSGNTAAQNGSGFFVGYGEVPGNLALHNVTVTGNTGATRGGGIANEGLLSASNSTISDNSAELGAGIYNEYVATISDSTISGNSAVESGGGVRSVSGSLTLEGSTVNDNEAADTGGGIASSNNDLILINSTVSGNFVEGAGGGIYASVVDDTADTYLINATITGNEADSEGGGIVNSDGNFYVTNSIIAGNSDNSPAPKYPDCLASGSYPTFPISEYNIVGDDTGCDGFFDTAYGNQVGDSTNPLDPRLGRLFDSGGPTLTHAPLYDSPARDAGDPAGCIDVYNEVIITTDQRGVGRPRDGDANGSAICDVGAYEAGLNNDSWPRALELTLTGDPLQEEVFQTAEKLGQSLWYKFEVQPGSQVIVKLTDLPINYDVTLFKDIDAAYQELINPQDESDLVELNAEFAPDAYAPDAYAPDAYAPDAYAPDAYAPDAYAPDAYAPDAYAPDAYAPDAYAPDAYAPDAYAPDAYAPDAYAPDAYAPDAYAPDAYAPDLAYTGAQMRSLLAVSAFDGTADESITVNTWDNTGDFYIRVRGRNGVFDAFNPFHLTVTLNVDVCEGVSDDLPSPGVDPFGPNIQTLILTDLDRMGADDPLRGELETKLQALASRPEVQGLWYDVGSDQRVLAANAQADANTACPYAKNLVAYAVKDIIDAFWTFNPDLRYIVIVGNDDVIPFFRHPDRALLANEKNFVPPVFDNTHSQASLKLGYVLSQDRYGAEREISVSNVELPIPGLAVGRLVESYADVINMLDAYSATVDAGTPGVVPPPDSALVTGYDFLADVATEVQDELEAGIGTSAAELITDRDVSPLDPAAWTADDLRAVLLGNRHDLIFLAGHFSASSALAADYDTRLLASELVASGVDLENALIFSAGCHSGYNIVNQHGVPNVTVEPDWAQAFAQKGATFIGGTGYQYGDTDFLEYSEEIYLMFSQQLRYGTGPIPVGEALMAAKGEYLATTPQLRGIHEKALLEATLFGLPMLSVDMPAGRGTPPVPPPIVTAPATYATNPGAFLGLAFADVSITPNLTQNTKTLQSVNSSDTLITTYFSGGDGVMVNPAEPILPLELRNVSVPGTVLRGVGFRGGTYADLPDVFPLTGAAATEIRGVHPPFLSDVFFPIQAWRVNYFGALADPSNGITRLAVTPGQFRSNVQGTPPPIGPAAMEDGTSRQFTSMDFRLFYSNNIAKYGSPVSPTVPALAAPPAITKVLAESVGQDVNFEITVLGDPAAGIQEVWVVYTLCDPSDICNGIWQPLDLIQNSLDSTLWERTLTLPSVTPPENVRYMVQAVNGVGLVALATNLGEYYVPDIDPGQLSAGGDPTLLKPTTLSLSGPTSGAYSTEATFSVLLTSEGEALPDQLITLALGSQQRQATTDANGLASVDIPLLGTPGPTEVRASFAGNTEYLPSSATSPFTINKQGTLLSLAPQPAIAPEGADTGLIATLKDAGGNRLREKTIVFLVSGGGSSHTVAEITNFVGEAPLGIVPLPPGQYQVTAYFGSVISLADGSLDLTDPNYGPSTAQGTLTIERTTAVTLVSFTATQEGERVTVEWTTGAEIDTVGFNLYRATSLEGPWTQINADLIPATGDPFSGDSYIYVDTPGEETFFYILEDLNVHGEGTLHTPVMASPPKAHDIYLPLIYK